MVVCNSTVHISWGVIQNITIVKSGCGYACSSKGVEYERCVVILKPERAQDGKICISQSNIMKTVIPLEKKKVFQLENIAYQKDAIPDWTSSLHHMSAVLPIVREEH